MSSEVKITDTLQKYYDKVFQDGKLVNVRISIWGMSYSLTEDDIKIDNKLPEVIQLGKKMLIKPAVYNMFRRLEQKARNYLYANSFAFPLVPQAHFVPKSKYLEVYAKMAEFKEEFLKLKEEFIEKYPDYKAEAIAYYQEFSDQLNVDNLEAIYPKAETIEAKFAFDVVSFEIKLPTEFADIDVHTEVAREQAANEAKLTAQAQYKTEYNNQLNTHMGKINEFVGEVIDTLRSKVVEHCSVVLGKISKKEVVSESSIKTLMKHINEFRDMNFIEDRSIEEELSKVEKLLTGEKDFKKDKDAVKALQDVLSNVITEAKNMTDVANISGEYFRKLEV
jgi:hypothetical protein